LVPDAVTTEDQATELCSKIFSVIEPSVSVRSTTQLLGAPVNVAQMAPTDGTSGLDWLKPQQEVSLVDMSKLEAAESKQRERNEKRERREEARKIRKVSIDRSIKCLVAWLLGWLLIEHASMIVVGKGRSHFSDLCWCYFATCH
jgi:hypothetical protein